MIMGGRWRKCNSRMCFFPETSSLQVVGFLLFYKFEKIAKDPSISKNNWPFCCGFGGLNKQTKKTNKQTVPNIPPLPHKKNKCLNIELSQSNPPQKNKHRSIQPSNHRSNQPSIHPSNRRLFVVHATHQDSFHLPSILFGTRRGEPVGRRTMERCVESVDVFFNDPCETQAFHLLKERTFHQKCFVYIDFG